MAKSSRKACVATIGAGPALRVLLVEDELLVALSLESDLREIGCEVAGRAVSAVEADAIAATVPIDVALIDVRISGRRNGVELARDLRQNYGLQIVFMTGGIDLSTLTRAKELAPAAVLIKPFSIEALSDALESAHVALNRADEL